MIRNQSTSRGTPASDIDDNAYQTVKIGDQVWMAENLKVTHYRNGDAIPNVTGDSEWGNLKTGACCNYDNDANNLATYGLLYNWYAVSDPRGLAPDGWHVPSDAEWQRLVDFLGGADVAGGKMKESGTSHWPSPNIDATNESCFTTLPGGTRSRFIGYFLYHFKSMGNAAEFWSSSEYHSSGAWYRFLGDSSTQVYRFHGEKNNGISVRCVRDPNPSLPILNSPLYGRISIDNIPTFDWTDVTGAAAYELLVDKDDNFSSPEISQNKLTSSTYTPGSSLSDGTYYWKVRAKDNLGYWGGWSSAWSFTISLLGPGCGTVTDIDSNIYQTTQIGSQCWMTENLKATHYRNGDPIPNVTDNTEWSNLTSGAYCNYNNDPGNVATYGRLYNWYAVDDSRNIAPEGWHVPSDAEWKQLEIYLGMSQSDADACDWQGVRWDQFRWRGTDEGGKMKTTGTIEEGSGSWFSPNTGATNESGFSALPGGYRFNVFTAWEFRDMGRYASFWSSTKYRSYGAWYRGLEYDYSEVYRHFDTKTTGNSVRCVKD